jgi:hypothetical protein
MTRRGASGCVVAAGGDQGVALVAGAAVQASANRVDRDQAAMLTRLRLTPRTTTTSRPTGT